MNPSMLVPGKVYYHPEMRDSVLLYNEFCWESATYHFKVLKGKTQLQVYLCLVSVLKLTEEPGSEPVETAPKRGHIVVNLITEKHIPVNDASLLDLIAKGIN